MLLSNGIFAQSWVKIHPVYLQFVSGTAIIRQKNLSLRGSQPAIHKKMRKQVE